MRRVLWTITALGVLLAACSPAAPTASAPAPAAEGATSASTPDAPDAPAQETSVPTPLPDGPLAPDLTHDTWLNSEPLSSADLRGKVVLVDFWTFG